MMFSLFALLTTFQTAHAATANDFYCGEFTAGPTTYSEKVIKGCKGGVEETVGLCTQSVMCVYLTDEMKVATAKMNEVEKDAYFKTKHTYDWVNSTVTCTGVKTAAGEGLCPMPNKCKGDFFYNVSIARMNQVEYDETLERFKNNTWQSFPVHYDANEAKKAE